MLRAWHILALIVVLAFQTIVPGIATAADSGRGSITGTVVSDVGSPTARPIAGVEVQLTFGSKTDSRKTDANGKYQFTDLLPGKYTLRIVPPSGQKPKADASIGLSIDAGDTGKADFALSSIATPTPTAAPTSTPMPRASPSTVAASKPSSSAETVANGMMPVLVNPLASPTPKPSQSDQAALAAARQAQQIASGRPAVTGSPSAFDFGPQSILAAVGTGTPQATPSGTPNADDTLASGPPRRLITSFEALRDTGGGGTASQLKTFATNSSLVLGVPFQTQIDGTAFSLVNCGPASLSMVLNAFGVKVDPPSVRDYLNYLIGNYNTEQGTSLYTLGTIARQAGLNTFGVGGSSNLQGWTVDAIREQLRAGHPVITLTKYRRLPGHFGSVTEFDHYIVLTGLAGEDFVYNDAAYATEYGYNLLISPSQLERAWADSSVPRHAMAVGLGEGLHPLPIVPRGLTAESLAVPHDEQAQVIPTDVPTRMIRGPAAERLREEMLDRLGSRTAVLDTDLAAAVDALSKAQTQVPPTQLDPADVAATTDAPSTADAAAPAADPNLALSAVDLAPAPTGDASVLPGADAATTDATDATTVVALLPPSGAAPNGQSAEAAAAAISAPSQRASWSPIGMLLLVLGVALTLAGGVSVLRRRRSPIRTSSWRPVQRNWRPPERRRQPDATAPVSADPPNA